MYMYIYKMSHLIMSYIEQYSCEENEPYENYDIFNPLNPEINPICYLLALLAHHFLHVSRIRVKSLTIRLLMSYIYIYIINKINPVALQPYRALADRAAAAGQRS